MNRLIGYLVAKYSLDELDKERLIDGLSIATRPRKSLEGQAQHYSNFLKVVWNIEESPQTILTKLEGEQ